jgi:hypothetical protein
MASLLTKDDQGRGCIIGALIGGPTEPRLRAKAGPDHMAQQTRTEGNAPEQAAPERMGEGEASQESMEVQLLFDRMARALTAGDARTAANLWETPALVVDDQQVIAVSTRAEVEQFFASARNQYDAQGIVETRSEIMRLEWATGLIALVKVRWPYFDASGRERGDERSTYTVRRDETGELKVCVVILQGVTEPD